MSANLKGNYFKVVLEFDFADVAIGFIFGTGHHLYKIWRTYIKV